MSQEIHNKEKILIYPERKIQVTHKRKEIKMAFQLFKCVRNVLKYFRNLENYLNNFQIGILYLAAMSIRCDDRIKISNICTIFWEIIAKPLH